MINFPSIIKRGSDSWTYGPDVFVDPQHVICVQPRERHYHSFRNPNIYSVIYLSTGAEIEVFIDADDVHRRLEESRAADLSRENK